MTFSWPDPAPAGHSIGALIVSSASGQTAFLPLPDAVPIPPQEPPREKKLVHRLFTDPRESRPRTRDTRNGSLLLAPLTSA